MVVILTVLCVVIPILYLTPSTERGPLNAPVIVLLFFLGIAVLLAYIVFEILSIRRVATDREDDSDGGSQDRGSA
jgi:hypothetical protein